MLGFFQNCSVSVQFHSFIHFPVILHLQCDAKPSDNANYVEENVSSEDESLV